MIGLDYLMAGYVQLAAMDIECKLKKTPEISVSASDTKVTYDNSKTQAQLDGFKTDTVSPYAKNVQTHVGGLMSGEVTVSQNVQMMQETFPMLNAGCLYISKVDINIHINPTIYIAREYDPKSCMHKAVMEHEKKHIHVDRTIVNKYTRLIATAVDQAAKKIGYARGPYPVQQLVPEQQKIHAYMQGLMKKYSDQMSDERKRLQQNVDTLAEYERVQALCRGKK